MNPIFLGTVKQGKLSFNNLQQFTDYLKSLGEKSVEIIVRKIIRIRSNNQNRYYWGVVVPLLVNATGYTTEEMHEALKMLFLKDLTRKIPTLRSTADLTTTEFEDYLGKVRMWAAQELSCVIPDPNEVDFR